MRDGSSRHIQGSLISDQSWVRVFSPCDVGWHQFSRARAPEGTYSSVTRPAYPDPELHPALRVKAAEEVHGRIYSPNAPLRRSGTCGRGRRMNDCQRSRILEAASATGIPRGADGLQNPIQPPAAVATTG